MAKGSVRKKGKKWYYRFYIQDEHGNQVQKEYAGTEDKKETEQLMRQAMNEYDESRFYAKSDNITLEMFLDVWVDECLKPGNKSNGTYMVYQGAAGRLKKMPFARRKIRTITVEDLQKFWDSLCFGTAGQKKGETITPPSASYMRTYRAVLTSVFRFAVYPKKLLPGNLMDYIQYRSSRQPADIFSGEAGEENLATITHEQFLQLLDRLKGTAAYLPVQIAYYTGIRIGEACGLAWTDINLTECTLTVKRTARYNTSWKCYEIGATKSKKTRTIYFGENLLQILKAAKKQQQRNRLEYGELYSLNYYKEVLEKGRTHYEVKTFPIPEEVPVEYREIPFVCTHKDGRYSPKDTVGEACRCAAGKIPGLEGFHFHMLRHTYTNNLLKGGVSPKDVQELLGHASINTTMNIYAHSSKEAKKQSASILEQVVGGE